jgi:RNA polymerase subunit RPABC4/transcription elongation factor Spt4
MTEDIKCKVCGLVISHLDDTCPGCNKATGFAVREKAEVVTIAMAGGYAVTMLLAGCARMLMQ